jgi:acetyl-CoA C-acetyltransferase
VRRTVATAPDRREVAMLSEVYIAGSVRTPIGRFCGAFAETPAVDLGAAAIADSLRRIHARPAEVDEVIMGNVISAGLGQNVARQCSINASLPTEVPAMTINKVCGSGLKAVMLAAQYVQCGDADLVVAGGTENMSRAPYVLNQARSGYRMGDGKLIDALVHDGLWDTYGDIHMGCLGDRCADNREVSRQDQDDFAVESYRRARRSLADGSFAPEIVPVKARQKRETVTVDADEEPQRFDEQKLRSLRPAFAEDGTVTAGNASSVNDGAATVCVLSPRKVEQLGVQPDARILGYTSMSRDPEWFTLAPIRGLRSLMRQLELSVAAVDLFEINEAFSCVPLAAMKELKIPHEKVNVLGGAVALGHPIGASGSRILVTLLNALKQRGGKVGVAALCIGGGESVVMAVERL